MDYGIPTNDGIKIPNLCAWKKEQRIACDVGIAAVAADLDFVHERKAENYDIPDIYVWMPRKHHKSNPNRNPLRVQLEL